MDQSQQIKDAGLKVTVPRVKILNILQTTDQRHLSAEDVYKELLAAGEDIGLATVYRVLTQFEASGLLCRHHFEGGQSVFELDHGGHHDHLVCVKCGLIVEFFEQVIEERQRAIAEQNGFKIEHHALVIYGICPNCQQQAKTQSR
ncbi:ferric iron uptake transcriptional regulator [Rhabdochromatium marinum]|uniref:ferric iron uptake transcriptional regulator n=1 Tax=Rhabdochromatium marinum TaxID=48729 RepID=UPI00190572A6|nr:ferric iron uptake transcriptional regulator [Rhabdochromatium marinum]MBK1649763.1 ferric iron uptake transcriptional regulator [Rhabdochromatium marinum]